MKAFRIPSILSCSVVALTFVATVTVARADSYSVSTTIAPAFTNFGPPSIVPASTGSVAHFNSSLGTLQSVEITLDGGGTTVLTVSANTSSPTVFTALSTSLDLTLTDPTDANVNTLETMSGGPAVSPTHPITVVQGTPYNSGTDTLAGLAGSQTFNTDLGSFIGPGNVTFDLAGYATTTESFSGGDFTAGQTTDAGAGVTVTYNYTLPPPPGVTPEPGTLVLFGSGLLLLAGLIRFKHAQSR